MQQPKDLPIKKPEGNLFIISAPSGAGKTTLCNALLKRFPDICYSVSHTTRPPRGNEKQGVDYFFIQKKEFETNLQQGYWAEWAEVHGNFYATSHKFLTRNLKRGRDILLDIDVQGTRQILKNYPDSITIFVMPPSLEMLRLRLESRGTDSQEAIERRLRDARKEMQQRHLYRHIVVNDRLNEAVDHLVNIVKTYRSIL
jgi:guanylate kinase